MATQLFCSLLNTNVPSTADDDWELSTSRGSGVRIGTTNTVAGPTAGVQVQFIGVNQSWWYRVNAVTISGAITKNVWMAESAMTANVGAQVIIERCDSTGAFISTVQNSEFGTEAPVTTRAAQNWATGSVTSTTFADGDYIRVYWLGNDGGGTMASGNSFTTSWAGTSAAADGDTYVTFTETITEYTAQTFTPYPRPYIQLLPQ